MTRLTLLALSVVDCAFGATYLYGPEGLRAPAFILNFLLAVVLAVLTAQDLRSRGMRLGWLVGLSYIAAPLVGLVLYAIFSSKPRTVAAA